MSENYNNEEITPIEYFEEENIKIPMVDKWNMVKEDQIFKTSKGVIMAPIYEYFNIQDSSIDQTSLNAFIMTPKRSYNNPKMRNHIIHYMNYFEKYYDQEYELLAIYARIKYLIDFQPEYSKDALFSDLFKYFMHGPLSIKMDYMNNDNYSLHLTYKNKNHPELQYTDTHGKILMKISLIMNFIIPILCHFMYVRKVDSTVDFLNSIYDKILHLYDVDIYNKLYETAASVVDMNVKRNKVLWEMQDIRGINSTTHILLCVHNIIINIIPKYIYSENLIHFNYRSIKKHTGYQITDIGYEYDFRPLSSYNRDEDNNSEFDKYESFLPKESEDLYIQNKVNSRATMELIQLSYGPFNQEDIEFYKRRLAGEDGKVIINSFQMSLVFNLFYKFFGDTNSIKAINLDEYIILIMAAKRILEANKLVMLPYIISGKVIRMPSRKNINKRELSKMESTDEYKYCQEKYDDEKLKKQILSIIAQIVSSDFEFIEPNDEDGIDGKPINIIPELIGEEVLLYVSLI